METWALKNANAVTCICDGIRNDLVARGIPREKITLVPNAVDASRFQPVGERDPAMEAQLNLAGKRVVAL